MVIKLYTLQIENISIIWIHKIYESKVKGEVVDFLKVKG